MGIPVSEAMGEWVNGGNEAMKKSLNDTLAQGRALRALTHSLISPIHSFTHRPTNKVRL
jgi:hypothetical protein